MIPIRLAFGGDLEPVNAGEQFLNSNCCPYARSCLGYQVLGNNPYYGMLDGLCVAQTCESMKRVSEYFQKYFDMPVFPLGLPHTHEASRCRPQALWNTLRKNWSCSEKGLEGFSDKPIRDRDIRKSITLCNDIREKLRLLFEYPRSNSSPIEWGEVVKITQAGFVIDRRDYLTELGYLVKSLAKEPPAAKEDNRPLLMITGSLWLPETARLWI